MHIHGQGLVLLPILGVLVSFMLFVAWWAAVGWGVSIAHRVYRWGMRRHDRKRAPAWGQLADSPVYTPAQRSSR